MTLACCPDCGADLEDEGLSLWCPACQQPVPWEAAMLEDPDGERDDLADRREAARDA